MNVWELIKKIQNKEEVHIVNEPDYVGFGLITQLDTPVRKMLDEAIKVSAINPDARVIVDRDRSEEIRKLQDQLLIRNSEIENLKGRIEGQKEVIKELYRRIDKLLEELNETTGNSLGLHEVGDVDDDADPLIWRGFHIRRQNKNRATNKRIG